MTIEVKLLNNLVFHAKITLPCTADDILKELSAVYKIDCPALFGLYNGYEVLLNTSVIIENNGLRALPMQLWLFNEVCAENEFVMYQVFYYCFYMFYQSKWPCSDVYLVRLLHVLLKINAEMPIVQHYAMLLPERQRALFDYYCERCYLLDIAMEKNKLLQFVNMFRESAYFGFVLFPVIDVEQDWTSLFGVCQDGVVLIDAELGTAYLYFQHDYFRVRVFEDRSIQFQVDQALRKVRSYEYTEYTRPQLADQRVPKIIDFIANTTKSIELPVFSKLPDEQRDGVYRGERFRQFKVQQTEKFIAKINQGPDVPESAVLQKQEIIPVRYLLTLTFASPCVCYSVFAYVYHFYELFDPCDHHPRRSLRVMSNSTAELFKYLYMNNCVKYCVRPLRSLVARVDAVLDSGCGRVFNDLTLMRERITHMHVRSFVQAALAALDFDPVVGSFRVDSARGTTGEPVIVTRRLNPARITRLRDGATRFFRGGAGTPYDPFVPIYFGLYRNFTIYRAALISSDFTNIAWVQEIAPLLQHPVVCKQLKALEVSDNLLMNKGAIVLAARCAGLHSLRALHLNNCKIKQTGLSCLLYLLDSENVYLYQISLQGVKCHTKAAFQQLGIYIGRCWKRYGIFERLDLSRCQINLYQAQGFRAGCIQGSGTAQDARDDESHPHDGLLATQSTETTLKVPQRPESRERCIRNDDITQQCLTQQLAAEHSEATESACNYNPEHNREETSETGANFNDSSIKKQQTDYEAAYLLDKAHGQVIANKVFTIETLVCKRCFYTDALAQETMYYLCQTFITQ